VAFSQTQLVVKLPPHARVLQKKRKEKQVHISGKQGAFVTDAKYM
jgi:hypothetical protein